jgi:hypothetical protein
MTPATGLIFHLQRIKKEITNIFLVDESPFGAREQLITRLLRSIDEYLTVIESKPNLNTLDMSIDYRIALHHLRNIKTIAQLFVKYGYEAGHMQYQRHRRLFDAIVNARDEKEDDDDDDDEGEPGDIPPPEIIDDDEPSIRDLFEETWDGHEIKISLDESEQRIRNILRMFNYESDVTRRTNEHAMFGKVREKEQDKEVYPTNRWMRYVCTSAIFVIAVAASFTLLL